jgi:GNAT superfamily N-acetyltransferase
MNQNSIGKITVRKAGRDDCSLVKTLYSQLTQDIENVDKDFCAILDDPNAVCLILEDETPIGMVTCYIRTSLSSGKKMVIDEIIIDTPYRGKGYGRALMEYCITMAKDMGVECVELTCSLTRQNLHRFYESMRFEHTMRLYHLFLGDEQNK